MHDWGTAAWAWRSARRSASAARDHGRRAAPAGLPLAPGQRASGAPHSPVSCSWGSGRAGPTSGSRARATQRRVRRPTSSSTASGTTSTTAPSARSSSSTAPPRRRSWPSPGERLERDQVLPLCRLGRRRPYVPSSFANAHAAGPWGQTRVEVLAGVRHWPWVDDPGVIDRVRRLPGRLDGGHRVPPAFARGRSAPPGVGSGGRGAARGARPFAAAIVPDAGSRKTGDLAAHTVPRELFGQRGLHGLERPLVRRAPHARLQPAVPADRLAPRTGRWPGHRRRRGGGAVRAAGPRTTSAASARAGERSGSASAPPRCCSPAGCRSRSAWRSGWPRCSPFSAAATLLAVVLAVLCPLGSPVAGFFLALAAIAYWLSSRPRAARCIVAAAASSRRSCWRWRSRRAARQPFAFSAFIAGRRSW